MPWCIVSIVLKSRYDSGCYCTLGRVQWRWLRITYIPCKPWWRAGTTLRAYAEGREFDPRVSANEVEFSLCRNFFSRSFTCRIVSCTHWEDEFRCISLIFGKFNEDSQRHNHPSWMVMQKTVNGITIQVKCLCRRQSTAWPSKWNGYAEDSQRHNHPSWMFMPNVFNGINI